MPGRVRTLGRYEEVNGNVDLCCHKIFIHSKVLKKKLEKKWKEQNTGGNLLVPHLLPDNDTQCSHKMPTANSMSFSNDIVKLVYQQAYGSHSWRVESADNCKKHQFMHFQTKEPQVDI